MIILNVDPWVFNRKNLQSRWKVFTNELNQFASESGIDVGDYVGSSIGTAKIRTLLSVEYLVESLKTLLHSNQKGRSYEVTNDAGHPKGAILADGSYVSPEERRYIAEDVLLKDAVNYVMQKPVYSLESFYSLDPVLVQMFEYLLNDMLSNGIEVTLLLTPYHPVTYELLHREGYQVINEVESYLIAVASSLNIKLRGSYDPQHTGCASEWFTDGMHPTMECMQVLISLDIS